MLIDSITTIYSETFNIVFRTCPGKIMELISRLIVMISDVVVSCCAAIHGSVSVYEAWHNGKLLISLILTLSHF